MKKLLMMVPVVALAAGTTGCATKKFVRTEVGSVNEKVTTLTSRVEENEHAHQGQRDQDQRGRHQVRPARRSGRPEGHRGRPVGLGGGPGGQGRRRQDDGVRSQQPQAGLRSRDQRGVGRLQVRERRRCRTRRRRSSTSWWPASPPTRRPCSSRSRATRTRPVPRRPTRLIGLERAEAVKRYLYEQHHVPLHKISVISYGETKPVDSNGTRAGRARNRRVEVKVLSPEAAVGRGDDRSHGFELVRVV